MRKFFMLGMVLTVSVVMLLTSCKKEEVNNNGNNNGNTENPGGSGSGDQEYPSTAVVLPNAVTDIDGNSYDAVQIGNQVWMAENLRTTKYADGTTIPMGGTVNQTEPCRYAPGPEENSNEENMVNVARYGYLYNWPAVMHGASGSEANPSGVQGICPNGWHVPSHAEWIQLKDYMKTKPEYFSYGNAEYLAKALAATWGWNSVSEDELLDWDYDPQFQGVPGINPSTNNATGFSALPAGRYHNYFAGFGEDADFWSATNMGYSTYPAILVEGISYDHPSASLGGVQLYIETGYSVRCVRD